MGQARLREPAVTGRDMGTGSIWLLRKSEFTNCFLDLSKKRAGFTKGFLSLGICQHCTLPLPTHQPPHPLAHPPSLVTQNQSVGGGLLKSPQLTLCLFPMMLSTRLEKQFDSQRQMQPVSQSEFAVTSPPSAPLHLWCKWLGQRLSFHYIPW